MRRSTPRVRSNSGVRPSARLLSHAVGDWRRRPRRLPPRRLQLPRRQQPRPPRPHSRRPSWQRLPRRGPQRLHGSRSKRPGWTPPIPPRRPRWPMSRKRRRTIDIAGPPNGLPKDSHATATERSIGMSRIEAGPNELPPAALWQVRPYRGPRGAARWGFIMSKQAQETRTRALTGRSENDAVLRSITLGLALTVAVK